MKTELIRKVMVVGGATLMGITVCVSVWFFLREQKVGTPQGQSRDGIAADNQAFLQSSQKPAGNIDEESLTRKERVTRQASSMFMSSLSEEQLATPFAQKMLEAMDSPEYLDLMESRFTIRQWNDFLESQGVPVERGYPGLFRKIVPNMELADYEQVVRRKLAELFIAAEPVDLTDPVAAARQRSRVYLRLAEADMATAAWFLERFGEDRDGAFRWEGIESNPAFIWMTDVQRNAAGIVAAAEAANLPETQASAPSWDLSSIMEGPPVFPDDTEGDRPSINTPQTDVLERPTVSNTEKHFAASETGLFDVPQVPSTLPTAAELETVLKGQFSPDRFERAMSALKRYGPEEGLRRLREDDPEVAKQVENSRFAGGLRHRSGEEDSK